MFANDPLQHSQTAERTDRRLSNPGSIIQWQGEKASIAMKLALRGRPCSDETLAALILQTGGEIRYMPEHSSRIEPVDQVQYRCVWVQKKIRHELCILYAVVVIYHET
jgi:hypothetical protein